MSSIALVFAKWSAPLVGAAGVCLGYGVVGFAGLCQVAALSLLF